MKLNLKTIVVCFIAAPLAAIGLSAAAGSNGSPAGPGPGPGGEFGGPGSRGEGPPPRGNPLLELADDDGDGVLSAAEIQGLSVLLLSLDVDGDGMVGRDELDMALPPPRPPRGRDGPAGGPRDRALGPDGAMPPCPVCDAKKK